MKIYLVGGAVRDQLLGREIKERDWVVVGSTPEDMQNQGYRAVGKDFPVFLHPQSKEEYALARTERKTGPGYTGFSFHAAPDVTLEEDLKRRDLTINAIAQSKDGEIIDPYHGQQDLHAKILRHVSANFSEDPVRILRLARFAARFPEFTVHHDTNQLMRDMVQNGEVDALVPERVWQELSTALNEIKPSRFFVVLHQCGALQKLFPEIENLYGVPNKTKWHPEVDSFIHTMMVLDVAAHCQFDEAVRFAALTHDLGKAQTPRAEWPSHKGHDQKSLALIKQLCQRIKVPKTTKELALLVAEHHSTIHRCHEMNANTIVKLLEKCDAYRRPQRFEQILEACEADARGRLGFSETPYTQKNTLLQAYKITSEIDTSEITQQLSGPAISNKIHECRVNALNAINH